METRTAHLNLQTILAWTEEEARAFLERWRWPEGPVCPKCGDREPWTITRRHPTKNHQVKLYKCRACKRQYTATVGTIFEDSHIPLNKWIGAMFILCSSKKGVSAHQIRRMLWNDEHPGNYKSAWYMLHRIREAMLDKAPCSDYRGNRVTPQPIGG